MFRLISYIKDKIERNNTLKELSMLDDRMLSDIGITRGDICFIVPKVKIQNYVEFKEVDYSKVQSKYI